MRDNYTDYDDGYDCDYDTPNDMYQLYDEWNDEEFWGTYPY